MLHYDFSKVPDAVPQYEPDAKIGNKDYQVKNVHYKVLKKRRGFYQYGMASWYGIKFHGRKTSNAEHYNMFGMTAAHKHLPLPTYVRVTNLNNHKNVIVRINDRGPFVNHRIIDLSYAAAWKLGMLGHGTAPVYLHVIMPDEYQAKANHAMYAQLGAFKTKQAAVKMKNKLSRYVADHRLVIRKDRKNNGLYKVIFGPLDHHSKAQLKQIQNLLNMLQQ